MKLSSEPLRCPCHEAHFQAVYVYTSAPEGETRFPFSSGSYRREIKRCGLCGHFISIHNMDCAQLYSGEYVTSTYGDDGIRRAFDRINALPPAESDNVGRVRRILEFTAAHLPKRERPFSVLDVGSGLCVFLHRMKAAGWACTALDPDPRAVAHAQQTVGVSAVYADFLTAQNVGRFDLVTFNKVLEHAWDPVAMLARSADCLHEGGLVYVELPDGEAAVSEGFEREEFFIEHHHIFSPASLGLLAIRAGFAVKNIERLREPSTKFTLRAFLHASSRSGV